MVLRKSNSFPTVELDLTFDAIQKPKYHNINVYRLETFTKYPAYSHMLKERAPFNVKTVIVDGGHKITIDKTNVGMVTVYFDDNNKILMFETLYDDEKVRKDGPSIHRYHAKDIKRNTNGSSGLGESTDLCWMEYMYGNNDTLDTSNVDSVLEEYKKRTTPLDRIRVSGKYFTVVRPHEHCNKYCYKRAYSDATLGETEVTEYVDLEAQREKEGESGKFTTFITSSRGMVTAVATGSVGGAAIGGTIIYMVAS